MMRNDEDYHTFQEGMKRRGEMCVLRGSPSQSHQCIVHPLEES